MEKQVIKIKPTDLNKATIRAFGRAAWQAGQQGALSGKVQLSRKKKEPKYKSRFQELEQ